MARNLLICMMVLYSTIAFSQADIVSYEYWFDHNYGNRTLISIGPTKWLNLNTSISTGDIEDGMHVLHFRARDAQGKYSSISTDFFVKLATNNGASNGLASYEYWFDNDYDQRSIKSIEGAASLNEQASISTDGLGNGMHLLHFRSRDTRGLYSSISSNILLKLESSSNEYNRIIAYEYWYDNDFSNRIQTAVTPQANVQINLPLTTASVSKGMHVLHVRAKDDRGNYSGIISHFFIKSPQQTDNKIVAFRYWFNDHVENAIQQQLKTPAQQVSIIDNIDMTRIPKGTYTVHFQFRDAAGAWSAVTTDTIEKRSFPVADFTYALTRTCDSTVITLEDSSIDADTYLWDFGDDATDSISDPSHAYYAPGRYTVKLTVNDTTARMERSKEVNIEIGGNTYRSVTAKACDSYLSPGGSDTYFVSGVYKDTIPNSFGCDSIITTDLTIHNSVTATDVVTACKSYTWIDLITYTESNNSAIHILKNMAGCDSVVSLNLTIISVDTSLIQDGATLTLTSTAPGAEFQWLDCDNGFTPITGATGSSFTATQIGHYAAEITQQGCTDTTDCHEVTSVGMPENASPGDLKIYPNPTKGSIIVETVKEYGEFTLTVHDIHGSLIQHELTRHGSRFRVDIEGSPGIYILTLISEDHMERVKIVKSQE